MGTDQIAHGLDQHTWKNQEEKVACNTIKTGLILVELKLAVMTFPSCPVLVRKHSAHDCTCGNCKDGLRGQCMINKIINDLLVQLNPAPSSCCLDFSYVNDWCSDDL